MAPKPTPPVIRFMAKINRRPSGCWEWTAYRGANGYGRFYVNDRGALAHRWAYEHFVGPIPEGLHIDHLCRNRGCVNPDHLEPVTPAENTRRGIGPEVTVAAAAARTHCKQGHPYSEDNTYISGGSRACLTCKRDGNRRHYERNRADYIEQARQWRLANPERARELGREGQRRHRAKRKQEVA